MEPFGKAEVCKIKLKGDWQLKIKFTYTISDIPASEAKLIAREPEKKRVRQEEGLSSDPIQR